MFLSGLSGGWKLPNRISSMASYWFCIKTGSINRPGVKLAQSVFDVDHRAEFIYGDLMFGLYKATYKVILIGMKFRFEFQIKKTVEKSSKEKVLLILFCIGLGYDVWIFCNAISSLKSSFI